MATGSAMFKSPSSIAQLAFSEEGLSLASSDGKTSVVLLDLAALRGQIVSHARDW